MANYVDYDYWLQGYGQGDLSQPDYYVLPDYWEAGYAEYDETSSSASITAIATAIAKAADFVFGSAFATGTATVSALANPDPYVVTGYWVGGYCEYDDISPVGRITAAASLSAYVNRIVNVAVQIDGNADVIAIGEIQIGGNAHVGAFADVNAIANYIAHGSASIGVVAHVSALAGPPIYKIAANVSEVRIARSISIQEINAAVQVVKINLSIY